MVGVVSHIFQIFFCYFAVGDVLDGPDALEGSAVLGPVVGKPAGGVPVLVRAKGLEAKLQGIFSALIEGMEVTA